MYKQASRLKLKINTKFGLLMISQLWDLSLTDLDELAVELKKQKKQSSKKSFLSTKNEKDKKTKLAFDIVLDILTTKVEENEKASKAKSDKEHNEKILTMIAEKEDGALKEKSLEELKKMLK